MSKTDTGGPAFARPSSPAHEYGFHKHQDGMTLRDYFAAKAMNGMCFGAPIPQKNELETIAKRSYEMADAMLKAREQ